MITDDLLLFSSAQSLVGAAATTVSTNTIDQGAQARDLAAGEDLWVSYNVDIAFTGGTSMQVQVITSAAANLSSPTVLGQGPIHLEAALVAGFRNAIGLPVQNVSGAALQRYLGVQYVTVGTHTTGAITTRIVREFLNVRYYQSGYSVL